VWCLVIATVIFLAAQLCALSIENPRLLLSVSTLSGLGYGFLFGVFPSIVAEQFGIHGMSQNWGFLTMAPTITSNVFNLFYGHIYDQQVTVKDDGERVCMHGLGCYKDAYWLTLAACAVGLGVCLWVIHYTKLQRSRIFAKEGGQL
jgi:MFS family permease